DIVVIQNQTSIVIHGGKPTQTVTTSSSDTINLYNPKLFGAEEKNQSMKLSACRKESGKRVVRSRELVSPPTTAATSVTCDGVTRTKE
ncbi:hypothetical protein A2U01_0052066, partial [Trifolium medium]|nr:hypothetical protein [Trifolium medium]